MALIIYSGGLDSTVLLYKLASEGRAAGALSINYGQKHVKELEFARFNAEKLGVPFQTLDLGCLAPLLGDNSLTSSTAVPDGDYDDENMKSTVVPNRNMIMLSIAAARAIAIGADSHYEPIKLERPFVNFTKADIVKLGAELGVDFSKTWSCYKGGEAHCGTCGTCTERKMAFRDAGVEDPTEYMG